MKCKKPKFYHVFVFCSSSFVVYMRMRISTSKQHKFVRGPLRECRSIRSSASRLPYYCTSIVCISVVIGLLLVWRHNKSKTKIHDRCVFCSITRLFVCLRMRMYTSKQYANVYVEKFSYVRGPLRECRSIRSGASGLPYYCAPLVCVSEVIELLVLQTKNHGYCG